MRSGRAKWGVAVFLAMAPWALACGQAGSSSSGGGGSAAAGTSPAAAAGSAGATGNAGGGGAGASTDGSSDPVLCGGAYAQPCAAGKLCVFDTTCGTVGHCVPEPSACDAVSAPVCGCDGEPYANDCEARRADVAVQHAGPCDAVTQFACGPFQCSQGTYCLDKSADGDVLWPYACLTLPAACSGTASCKCLGDVKACFGGYDCAASGVGVTATCK